MDSQADLKTELVLDMLDSGILKFGSFTLKGGQVIPIYFDVNLLISFPKLLKKAGTLIQAKASELGLAFDVVCGVPLAALAVTTAFALQADVPMLLKRKEPKKYGMEKLVEGLYEEGSRCLVIEDVTSSGRSVWETTESLRKEAKLIVRDAVALIELNQGAIRNLGSVDVKLHGVLDVHEIVEIGKNHGKLNEEMARVITDYIKNSQTTDFV